MTVASSRKRGLAGALLQPGRCMPDITLLTVVARIHPETWARIHPEIWDWIVPHGPVLGPRVERVFLNPQPLPPREALQIGAAEMAHGLVRMAVEMDLTKGSSADFVREFIDDWCATPWPRKWPSPWPGPRPDEGPSPEPWDVRTSKIVGAIVFASAGLRLSDGDLGTAFAEGAERLAQAAVADG
jgi:hypothetical protein